MNTSQIKTFAVQSRNILKSGVIQRIQILGFDVDGNLTKGEPTRIEIHGGATLFAGEIFDGSFYDRWMSLRHRIQEKGVKEVYEEAAYTWFNRLVAIRIMQKNGFIDPVLAYTNEQTRIPRIVAEARAGRVGKMSLTDREKLRDLMGDDARINEQFALLIDNFCRNNAVIFNCFGGIEEYISLLLPDNILTPGGFIDLLNHTSYISDDDFKQSELIGWLYQFYISEKKDEVFEGFKKGKKAEAEDIPAATQIFTPNWIVKYMVQNTLGRIYLDNNPYSEIKSEMKYLVEPSDLTPTDAILKIEDLADYKLIDPACGSGHILVEGFDLLYKMYLEEAYSSRVAIETIFQKNLIGIDIDTRAKQLATFALLMKAAHIDPTFVDCNVMPRVLDMPDAHFSRPIMELLREFFMCDEHNLLQEAVDAFELLKQAHNLGSIMRFNLSVDTRKEMYLRYKEWKAINKGENGKFVSEILPSVELILALSDKYTAVVANPPYMGSNNMNSALKAYVSSYYGIGKADMFSVMMMACLNLTAKDGKYGMINLPSWLFLGSFEDLRRWILKTQHVDSLIHMGRGIFGIDWGSVAFCITNQTRSQKGDFFRLHHRNFQHIYYYHIGQLFSIVNENHGFRFNFSQYREIDVTDAYEYPFQHSNDGDKLYYNADQSYFLKIPGSPFSYWLSEDLVKSFSGETMASNSTCKSGIMTGSDSKFVRLWYEPSRKNICLDCSHDTYGTSTEKWFPVNVGGYRKWYGNLDTVVNIQNHGYDIKHEPDINFRLREEEFYFREGIVWSEISSGNFSARYGRDNTLFFVTAPLAIPNEQDNLYPYLGLLNSCVANYIFRAINPTIHYNIGCVETLPISISDKAQISDLVVNNVHISKLDWDCHENSWDYKENELVRIYKENYSEGLFFDTNRLSGIISIFKEHWAELFKSLHVNEEELNRHFINCYGLQDELSPNVPLDEVTILQQGEVTIENGQLVWHDDVLVKQLISYAIGCMMGRYRLDRPGLHIAYPNPSAADVEAYDFQGEKFEIDDDGIIPLLPRDCPFDDNARNRLVKFIRQVFGESFLNENLNCLEASLGRTLEDYFGKEFWKDHKKMYSNRPIYWLFSSRKGAFQCLTYMHRMNPYTAEAVRSKYLLPYIEFLKGKIATDMERASSLSTVERRNLDKMQTALDECLEYEERLHDVADHQIRFDLDDGVLVNYAKFGDVLAKIK